MASISSSTLQPDFPARVAVTLDSLIVGIELGDGGYRMPLFVVPTEPAHVPTALTHVTKFRPANRQFTVCRGAGRIATARPPAPRHTPHRPRRPRHHLDRDETAVQVIRGALDLRRWKDSVDVRADTGLNLVGTPSPQVRSHESHACTQCTHCMRCAQTYKGIESEKPSGIRLRNTSRGYRGALPRGVRQGASRSESPRDVHASADDTSIRPSFSHRGIPACLLQRIPPT